VLSIITGGVEMRLVVSALLAGLLGAFPSGYVFTKLIGAGDIRRLGSGNVGGVNTLKSAGMLPGLLTLLCDFGKGALAVYLAGSWPGRAQARFSPSFALSSDITIILSSASRGARGSPRAWVERWCSHHRSQRSCF